MTTNYDLLTQLRTDWRYRCHQRASRDAFDLLRSRHRTIDFGGLADLGDLVTALDVGGGRTILERAQFVQALLEEAADATIRRALLQTLLPGIVSVCRQLRFGTGVVAEPSETLGVAVALADELLHSWAGESRQYAAPDVLSALRGRLRRWLLREKAARDTTVGLPDDVAAVTGSPLASRLESFCGGPYDRLARLTYARVFEGRSLRELALRDHSAPQALQNELQRFAYRFLV